MKISKRVFIIFCFSISVVFILLCLLSYNKRSEKQLQKLQNKFNEHFINEINKYRDTSSIPFSIQDDNKTSETLDIFFPGKKHLFLENIVSSEEQSEKDIGEYLDFFEKFPESDLSMLFLSPNDDPYNFLYRLSNYSQSSIFDIARSLDENQPKWNDQITRYITKHYATFTKNRKNAADFLNILNVYCNIDNVYEQDDIFSSKNEYFEYCHTLYNFFFIELEKTRNKLKNTFFEPHLDLMMPDIFLTINDYPFKTNDTSMDKCVDLYHAYQNKYRNTQFRYWFYYGEWRLINHLNCSIQYAGKYTSRIEELEKIILNELPPEKNIALYQTGIRYNVKKKSLGVIGEYRGNINTQDELNKTNEFLKEYQDSISNDELSHYLYLIAKFYMRNNNLEDSEKYFQMASELIADEKRSAMIKQSFEDTKLLSEIMNVYLSKSNNLWVSEITKGSDKGFKKEEIRERIQELIDRIKSGSPDTSIDLLTFINNLLNIPELSIKEKASALESLGDHLACFQLYKESIVAYEKSLQIMPKDNKAEQGLTISQNELIKKHKSE